MVAEWNQRCAQTGNERRVNIGMCELGVVEVRNTNGNFHSFLFLFIDVFDDSFLRSAYQRF